MRILKSHIGRPVDFQSSQPDEQPINGRIESVRRGIATVRFYVVRATDGSLRAHNPEGFTAYLPVRDSHILEVY